MADNVTTTDNKFVEELRAEIRSVEAHLELLREVERRYLYQPTFGGLSRAIQLFLYQAGKPLYSQDILNGLLASGYKCRSSNPRNSVNTTLHGMAKTGKIKKVGRGLWEFVEIIPPKEG
jgi:hypothetical protein